MKRTELSGGKPLERRTALKQTTELARSSKSPARPRAISPASAAQRRKVHLQACAVCGTSPCDPAHLTPRSFRGCDQADCVIALCRRHHDEFDGGHLDLLPHLAGHGFHAELAHMQSHYDDPLSVVFRLSGTRWVPADDRRSA